MSDTTAEKKETMSMEDFSAQVEQTVAKAIRDAGLDSVDRKHGMFGTSEDKNGDSLEGLTKEAKVAKFLNAVVFGDNVTAKALSEGVSADGGYLVPVEFRAQIIEKRFKQSVIRPNATVIPMNVDKLQVPAEANSVTTYWAAENAALTESDPTFGQVTLDVNKLTGLSKMSRELFADTPIQLVDFIANRFGKQLAIEEDKQFMTGSGTNLPKGIRQYTLTSIAQAGASLTGDDLIALFYALPVQYRDNAKFILPNSVIAKVRTLKDSQGRYLWTDGFNAAPDTLLGKPVLEQNDIPTNLGAGTNESEIFFGDLSYYLIGQREEMGVETTTTGAGAFENHQVAFKVWERIDGQLGLTDGFRKLTAVK